MTAIRKVLAQVATLATTETTLYTVPASTSTVVSSLVICNRGSSVVTFRVRVNVAGAGNDDKQFLYYDVIMPPNDTFIATIGITLGAGDVIKVYASTANVSWNLFGEEIS